jgi:hypothetical protein
MIAFDSDRPPLGAQQPDGHVHIWLINADGTGLHQLTTGGDTEREPRFSTDGLRVIYLYGHGGIGASTSAIQSVLLTGTNRQNVTTGTLPLGPFGLSISSDGRRIAFTVNAQPYILNFDGSGFQRVSDITGVNEVTLASRLPALFVAAPTSATTEGIFRLPLSAGAAAQQLTSGDAVDYGPSWTGGLSKIVPDKLPPAVGVQPSSTTGSASAARAADASPPLQYLAIDPSGISWIRAAIARGSKYRCRFLVNGRFGHKRPCRRPIYFDVPNPDAWNSQTQALPAGTYRVWFRASDTLGNTTRRPKPVTVRLP